IRCRRRSGTGFLLRVCRTHSGRKYDAATEYPRASPPEIFQHSNRRAQLAQRSGVQGLPWVAWVEAHLPRRADPCGIFRKHLPRRELRHPRARELLLRTVRGDSRQSLRVEAEPLLSSCLPFVYIKTSLHFLARTGCSSPPIILSLLSTIRRCACFSRHLRSKIRRSFPVSFSTPTFSNSPDPCYSFAFVYRVMG